MAPRSKISRLPQAVKDWLDKELVENGYGEYEFLSAELKSRGFDLSKSAIHRYGQEFEKRLGNLRMASEQAKAIVSAAPDDEGAVSEALMRLVQENLFQMMLDFKVDPDNPIDLPKAAKAVAELSRATVTQKKWQSEEREKIRADERTKAAEAATTAARDAGASPDLILTMRRALGITG